MHVPWDNELLQSVMENLTEGLIISDPHGQVLQCNKAALQLHGFASSQERTLNLAEFSKTFQLSDFDGAVVALEQWPGYRSASRNHFNWRRLREGYDGQNIPAGDSRCESRITWHSSTLK
jgi:PAS domain-containing protein